jgi:hypothetical protein
MPEKKNSKTSCNLLFVLLLASFCLLLLLSACSSSAGKVSTADKKVKRKVELPANFPTDFPKPENGKLIAAKQRMDERGEIVYYATWEISSSPQNAIDFYKQSLVANGWQIQAVTSDDPPDIAFKRSDDMNDSHLRVVTINNKHFLQVRVY